MAIKEKTIKILWSNAAGRCSFIGCNAKLTQVNEQLEHYTIGEMAHIRGKNDGSNRYDCNQVEEQRDGYENLILLCPTHHTMIDKPENEEMYSVSVLEQMKVNHECNISNSLDLKEILTIEEFKTEVSILLAENHQSWLQYGPLSENARKCPHSDKMVQLWFDERLSTIVPNNRKISKLINQYRNLLNRAEQYYLSQFLLHASSYEKWVNDEIPYHSVLRFPMDFENLILRS